MNYLRVSLAVADLSKRRYTLGSSNGKVLESKSLGHKM